MRFDMHLHVVGRGTDINQVDENVYFYPDDNNLFFTRILYGMVEKDLEKLGADADQSGTIDTGRVPGTGLSIHEDFGGDRPHRFAGLRRCLRSRIRKA